jgi:hypothetical protein
VHSQLLHLKHELLPECYHFLFDLFSESACFELNATLVLILVVLSTVTVPCFLSLWLLSASGLEIGLGVATLTVFGTFAFVLSYSFVLQLRVLLLIGLLRASE